MTAELCTMKISKKCVKPPKNNKTTNQGDLRGPLDKFTVRQKIKDDSLTLSDFECDIVDLDLSDIVNRIIA